VVVSMGAVAASGGYWASMTASHIVASPVTITGSIGVIGTWFYDNGLNSKLGITVDSIQRGDHADLMTGVIFPRRDLSDTEEARYRGYMMDLYAGFVARVAENRNMDAERVESLAQGRVYSGLGALNAGLIDSVGGINDAVSIARKLANIPDGSTITLSEYPKPKFFDKMLNRLLANKTASGETVSFIADLFISPPVMEELRFRISHNGMAIPVLPMDLSGGWQAK